MNFILGVICLVACTYVGQKYSAKYSLRLKFYAEFYSFNEKVKSEVLYTQNSMPQIIDSLDKQSEFFKTIKAYHEGNNFEQVKYLTVDENKHLLNYIQKVGLGDKESQLSFLNNEKNIIEQKRLSAQNNNEKYKGLYTKVGFLCGLIGLVIFV